MSSTSSSLLILTAACLWGTTGTVQQLAPAAADPVAVGAVRIVLGGVLLAGLAAAAGRLGSLRSMGRAGWAVLAVGAVCIAIYQTSYFAATDRTGVAVGTVVTIGSGPVFAGLLAAVFGHGRPSGRWLLATAVSGSGCGLLVLSGDGGATASIDPVGVGLALLSGLGYASYATAAAALIRRGADDLAVMGALFGGAGIVLAPALALAPLGWLETGRGVLVAVYLGAVTTTLGYLLYGRGLRTTPVPVAATLTLVEPAIAAALGVIVLGERLTPVGYGALGLLALGLVLLVTALQDTSVDPVSAAPD
ncbi:EamA family transporter [Nocardioides speluncae]|uniref:EamA family transporter n=1 Tax=Nocardioides speluncae TaxID=2670337 RepID=UPI001980A9D4|nr:EamA family transporter [Nocardioides speluncae]